MTVEDRAEFAESQGGQVDQLLNAMTVLLVLSVVIAVLGIVNTLALSVVERTRELGLLRAVGLQRRQLRRMIRVESVVIALYGALLGVLVGSAFGWALVRALEDQGVTEFALPYGRLAVVVLVAALAGVLAAALPARRAARLDVLRPWRRHDVRVHTEREQRRLGTRATTDRRTDTGSDRDHAGERHRTPSTPTSS